MKYVSIDIETTGLDKGKNQIVEIGAVIDELGSDTPIEDLPKFRAVLIHESMQMGAYCADLHRDLWPEILVASTFPLAAYPQGMLGLHDAAKNTIDNTRKLGTTYYLNPGKFEEVFYRWLQRQFSPEHHPEAITNRDKIKINVAGKNPGSFDIPFIEALPGWQGLVKFRRRVIDPAILYVDDSDNCVPDLQECLNRAAIAKKVSHTAVDDALDIVRLVRHRGVGAIG